MDDPNHQRYQKLQMALVRAREIDALREHHDASLRELRKDIAEREARHTELTRAAEAEALDLEKLERLSLKRLQSMVREGVEEARIREQVEAQAAVDAVTKSAHELSLVTQELYRVEDARAVLKDTDEQVELARVELEVHVRRHRPDVAAGLIAIEDRIASYQRNVVECKEAATAGKRAAIELEKLGEELVTARDLTWRYAMGGGVLVIMKMQNQLQVSTTQTRIAARALVNFDRELADTDVDPKMHILGRSRKPGALDVRFDNFLLDIRLGDTMSTHRKQTQRTHDEVRSAVDQLHRSIGASMERIEELDAERLDLLARPQDVRSD